MLERDGVSQLKYEVILNGVAVAQRDSRQLADMYVLSLSESEQNIAFIRPVTNDGKQILLD